MRLLPLFFLFSLIPPATAFCQDAVEPEPSEAALVDEVASLLGEGARALAEGDTTVAIERFESAVGLAPGMPEAWLVLARAREQAGQSFDSLEAGRAAFRLAPQSSEAGNLVGRQLARLGAVDQALAAFEQVRAHDAANLEATLLPALLLRDTGNPLPAIELLEAGRSSGIDSPMLLRELSLLYLGEGRAADALALVEPASDQHPQLLSVPMGMALIATSERRSEALPWLEAAFQQSEQSDPRLALELGTLALEDGRIDDAIGLLSLAANLDPSSAQAHYRLGTALRQQGDIEGAQSALERFQALSSAEDEADWDGRKIGTELNEAQNLATEGKPEEALAKIAGILDQQPADHAALSLRGKILLSMGQLEAALEAMSRAARLDPSRVEYHYLEGLFLLNVDRPGDAEQSLRRALALDDQLAETHQLLALTLAQQGLLEESLIHFQAALTFGVDNAVLRQAWAQALKALGRDEEAEAQLQAYRLLDGQ